MAEYTPSSSGDAVADVYDKWLLEKNPSAVEEATRAIVDFLAKMAGTGPVLELGIGTGRVAIPLSERGISVAGVEASAAMAEKLRAKPGGDRVRVHLADMADPGLPAARYSLVYVVASTFFALTTREAQQECFRNVAALLAPGGAFVMETGNPDLSGGNGNQRIDILHIDADEVRLNVAQYDTGTQLMRSQLVVLSDAGTRLYPRFLRYTAPGELDDLAAEAGLELAERWSDWHGTPFTPDCPLHVSVYRPG
ncbi:class I SAM-dependent DNA methyltransferase [Amycolatopsis magusensis]|uniref:class I SAM-dependent DNA methyltransferase n=1 Tax=Amycolatopsis magusensis TaxID=882444 RepID=UPI003C2C3AFE